MKFIYLMSLLSLSAFAGINPGTRLPEGPVSQWGYGVYHSDHDGVNVTITGAAAKLLYHHLGSRALQSTEAECIKWYDSAPKGGVQRSIPVGNVYQCKINFLTSDVLGHTSGKVLVSTSSLNPELLVIRFYQNLALSLSNLDLMGTKFKCEETEIFDQRNYIKVPSCWLYLSDEGFLRI